MKPRIIKEILNAITLPSQFDNDILNISQRNLQNSRLTIYITAVLGIIGIVIAIGFGIISKSLSEKQVQISLEQDTSKQMIIRQDQIIESLQKEFKLTQEIKNANENANKIRFIGAICKLATVISDSVHIMHKMLSADGVQMYIGQVMPILEGQLNNPFLCQDSMMLRAWNNAYVHLLVVGIGEQLIITEDGKQYLADNNGNPIISERVATPIDKISKTRISEYFFNAWKSVEYAYLYCGKKMRKDISKLINK